MFNKSLIEILCNVLGAIFLLAFVLHLSMFVWALVGTPPVEIYDVKKGLISYYALISQLASFVFYFVLAGAVSSIVKTSK